MAPWEWQMSCELENTRQNKPLWVDLSHTSVMGQEGWLEPDQFTLPIPIEMREVFAAWLLLRWYTPISAEDSSELYQHPVSYATVSASHWKLSTGSGLMAFPPCHDTNLLQFILSFPRLLFLSTYKHCTFSSSASKRPLGKKKGKGSIVMRPYIMLFPINILILVREGHVTTVSAAYLLTSEFVSWRLCGMRLIYFVVNSMKTNLVMFLNNLEIAITHCS